jgi:uncharacterized protein YfbU (UPF0304 family)
MATINIRVDDHVRDALKEMADTEGINLSEYIRDLLREAVIPVRNEALAQHGDEPAPETLRFMDRKVLSLLHRILGRVLPEDSNDVDGDREYQLDRARVLEEGFTGEYWMEAAGFATELSKRDSRRVSDILQMFRIIGYSLNRLREAGEPFKDDSAERLVYQGFDHNDPLEGQMASYVQLLVDDDKWSELKPYIAESDGGNSHMPMLDIYTRMLAQYRRIMDSRERTYSRDDYALSAEELTVIAEARVHPSNRR